MSVFISVIKSIILYNQFLLSSTEIEESTFFAKITDFQFLVDLHVLGCSENEDVLSGKCLSVCD